MTTEEQAANTFTLDDVYNQMTEWRNNKEKLGHSIPDTLWENIFSLEPKYSASVLKKFFSISNNQYETKRKQYLEKANGYSANQNPNDVSSGHLSQLPETIQFNEARLQEAINKVNASHSAADAKSQLKSLSNNSEPLVIDQQTVIVEVYRPDGALLKIHLKTGPLCQLINDFLNGGSLSL